MCEALRLCTWHEARQLIILPLLDAPLRFDVEEEVEVLLLQKLGEAALTEDVADHEVLLVLKGHDLLFDGAFGEHTIGHDGLRLADAVGTVDGLVLDGGIPPWIIQDDIRRGGEVETTPAGLQ